MARAKEDFTSLKNNIQQIYGGVFSVIQLFETAASPKTDAVLRGTGVPELLSFWLEPSRPINMSLPTRSASARAFARVAPIDA